MRNAFDRAERWRQRAVELRAIAGRMHDQSARLSLEAIADALDVHARKIEEMALKIHRLRNPPGPARSCRQTG